MNLIKTLSFLSIAVCIGVQPIIAQSALVATEIEQVNPLQAQKMVTEEGVLMFDVREAVEVEMLAYDVANIVNVPLSELETRINEIPKDKKVILACRSGKRSGKAAKILAAHGYTNMVNLEGGIKAWRANDLPIIKNGPKAIEDSVENASANSVEASAEGSVEKATGDSVEKACCADKTSKECKHKDGKSAKSCSKDGKSAKSCSKDGKSAKSCAKKTN